MCQQTGVGCYKDAVGNNQNSECTPCGVGKYTDAPPAGDRKSTAGHVDASACKDCPAGKFSDQERNMRPGACPPCATGKYQDGTGKSECKDCPAGKTTANTGAAAESDCVAAAATTPAPVLSTPPPCVPSYTTDCTLGLFGGLCPGGDNCSVPCGWPGECAFVNATSAGYTTLNNDACCATSGAAGCEGGQCAPGYMCGWWSMGGVTGSGSNKTSTGWEAKCFKCPKNTYKEAAANLRCTDCPAGKMTSFTGRINASQCVGNKTLSPGMAAAAGTTSAVVSAVVGATVAGAVAGSVAGAVAGAASAPAPGNWHVMQPRPARGNAV